MSPQGGRGLFSPQQKHFPFLSAQCKAERSPGWMAWEVERRNAGLGQSSAGLSRSVPADDAMKMAPPEVAAEGEARDPACRWLRGFQPCVLEN